MKHSIWQVSLMLVLTVLLLVTSVLPAAALTPYNTFSDAYRESVWHRNLIALNLTGDQRTDVVMVALSQLGYHEGDSDRDFAGTNTSGSRNFVEYNRLHGKVDNNEGNGLSYGYYWCASFATWCARQAGVATSVITSEISCTRLIKWFTTYSTYCTRASGYEPIRGDLIFFRASTDTSLASHVGIVMYVKNGTVYTVEGNTKADKVALRSYELTNPLILGYAVPEYIDNEETAIDYTPHGSYAPGKYAVNVSSLALRAAPTTASTALSAVNEGTMVTVSEISGNWGKTLVDGKIGWLSLSYLALVSAERYPIAFDPCGGTNAPDVQFKTHGKSMTLPSTVPTRSGYDFLGYATDKEAKTPAYQPGDVYTANAATTLYALWRPRDFSVTFEDAEGQVLSRTTYPYGTTPKAPEGPAKASDHAYDYTFIGWDKPLTAVTGDTVYRPVYDSTYIFYTVTFLDDNGNELAKVTGKYGDPIRVYSYPSKPADNTYRYEFDDWDHPLGPITGDDTYTASYRAIPVEYTVRFLDIEGNLIEEQTYHYNQTITDPPAIPYNLEHGSAATWDRPFSNVFEDTEYRAVIRGGADRLIYDFLSFSQDPSPDRISTGMVVTVAIALVALAGAITVPAVLIIRRRRDR